MDSIEKIIGLILLSGLFLTLIFIVTDLSKLAYKESGGFKRYIFNKIKKLF
jgi:hypothetical protein